MSDKDKVVNSLAGSHCRFCGTDLNESGCNCPDPPALLAEGREAIEEVGDKDNWTILRKMLGDKVTHDCRKGTGTNEPSYHTCPGCWWEGLAASAKWVDDNADTLLACLERRIELEDENERLRNRVKGLDERVEIEVRLADRLGAKLAKCREAIEAAKRVQEMAHADLIGSTAGPHLRAALGRLDTALAALEGGE